MLSNPVRAKLVPPDGVPPASIIAVALKNEEAHIGALWVAFDQPRQQPAEDAQFVRNIANQASLSIVNAFLYRSALAGRQRVEAILAATPDPVLVTDQRNRLLMVNPMALDLLVEEVQLHSGMPIEEAVAQSELLGHSLRAWSSIPETDHSKLKVLMSMSVLSKLRPVCEQTCKQIPPTFIRI